MKSLVFAGALLFAAAAHAQAPPPPAFRGNVHEVFAGTDVQSTIASSSPGDTVFFHCGSYVLDGLALSPGLLYVGPSPTYPLLGESCRALLNANAIFEAGDTEIYGLNFNGATLNFTGQNNTILTNNHFMGLSCYVNSSAMTNNLMQYNTWDGGKTCGGGAFWANLANVQWMYELINAGGGEAMDITMGDGSIATGVYVAFNVITDPNAPFAFEWAESEAPSTNTDIHFTDNWIETDNFGPSIISAGGYEFGRNFIHRIDASSGCFGGLEAGNRSPVDPLGPNIHGNYFRNDATDTPPPGSCNTAIWGLYDPGPYIVDSNNYWGTASSGADYETNASFNDLGIPPQPLAGSAD